MKTLPAPGRTRIPLAIPCLALLTAFAAIRPAFAGPEGEFRLTVRPGSYALEPAAQEGRSFRRVVASEPGRTAEPGLPSLPFRTFLLGVPEGTRLLAEIESAVYTDIPGERIQPAGKDTILGRENIAALLPAFDETAYRSAEWYPAEIVETGVPGRLRNQTVVPLRVHTFRTIPSTGLLRVCDEMVVRIRFVPDGIPRKGAASEPPGSDPHWANLYRRMIANEPEAGAYRTRRASMPAPRKAAGGPPEFKLRVRESGLYRIDYEELAAAGFPGGSKTSSIAIARRGFSEEELARGGDPFTETILPTLVTDEDTDGLFGPGDGIYAYLPGFREDRMTEEKDDRFASEAVYFLTTNREGRDFKRRKGWLGYPGLAPASSFPDSVRWEVDVFYEFQTPYESLDVYYPFRNIKDYDTVTVDLQEPDPSAEFRVKAMTVSNVTDFPYHRYMLVLAASGDTVFNEVVAGTVPALRTGAISTPASALEAGPNRLVYYGFRGPSSGNTYVPGAGGLFDWFEIRTSFLYRASGDYLRFSTGKENGRLQMEISGFSRPEILVLDVTDLYAPVLVEADSVRFEGAAYTAVLQDSAEAPRPYVACAFSGARRLEEGKIVRDEPTSVASDEADYLIVAHDDLFDATAGLAAYRESQGFVLARARVSDVYDEFNGGVKDPVAIQRYFRYAFGRWRVQPSFALLVGDGYEDARGIAENRAYEDSAEADLIPGYPFLRRSPGEGNNWYPSDSWFVLLDGPRDAYPEMLIGRFPAGSAQEVDALTEKTIAYETSRREEPWRRRVLFLADDAWVKDSAIYPYHDGRQTAFETGSIDLAKRVSNNSSVRADTVGFYLSRYTDVSHPLCPYPGNPTNPSLADHMCVIGLTRDPAAGATPALFDFLNGPGTSLLNYQGHGNRTSLTHELLLVHGKDTAFTGRFYGDLTDYETPGSPPYIFFAFGCSISEFDAFFSFGFDALGETALLQPESGAALTYGSTDLEFLDQNLRLNEYILGHWYPPLEKAARAEPERFPRTAGDVLASGMAEYAAATDDFGPLRRYVILGDPALRIGPDEPSLVVTAWGDTVVSGDTRLPRSDGSPWEVEAQFAGDGFVPEDSIRVAENGAEIADSLFTVESGVDSATNRWFWTVRRERPQDPSFRQISFRFADLFGNAAEHVLHTYTDIAVSFDGVPHEDSLVIPASARLRIDAGSNAPLSQEDFRAEAGALSFPADTLFRAGDSAWAAEMDLELPPGPVDLRVRVAGLSWTFPVRVAESGILITATVDGAEAASGHPLLGHLDGTPPVIVARVENLPGIVVDSIRILEGETAVPAELYTIVTDSADGRAFRRLTYRPVLRNGGGDIAVEARAGSVVSSFLLRASVPIRLAAGGTDLVDGDFIAGRSEVRAVASYPGDLPLAEATFLLDGAPIPPDTLRREGTDRWVATAAIEPAGGSHTVEFRAGAFSASRSVRVENRLRVEDALCHPNPVTERSGFYYQLTAPADEVRVEIYTITGRRIRVIESLSARVGYNENAEVWDGRDQDGDALARGAYLFRVIARRAGEKAESAGTIVIGRDSE